MPMPCHHGSLLADGPCSHDKVDPGAIQVALVTDSQLLLPCFHSLVDPDALPRVILEQADGRDELADDADAPVRGRQHAPRQGQVTVDEVFEDDDSYRDG